jgi:hypothetical protein
MLPPVLYISSTWFSSCMTKLTTYTHTHRTLRKSCGFMNNEVNKEGRKWSNKLIRFSRLSNNMMEVTVIREIKDAYKMSLKKIL